MFSEPIKADLAKLKSNMKKIQERVFELKEQGVRIRCRGKISGLDGKLIAWLTETLSMRRCNLCKLLPREYRNRVEYLFDELSLEAIDNIAAAILHFGKLLVLLMESIMFPTYCTCGMQTIAKFKRE